MNLYEEFGDACRILIPVDIVNTPGALVSMTTGEGAFTRASVGTYFDSNGVLQTAAVNVKRSTYDPANLMAPPNDLIEPAATNSIRNNTMVGAVAGQPGVRPSFWGPMDAETTGPQQGVTRNIVGTGIENGIEYIDVRFSGLASANLTFFVRFENAGAIPATLNQKWAHSAFHKLVSGVSPNIQMFITERGADTSSTGIKYTDAFQFGQFLVRNSMEYVINSSLTVSVYSGLAIYFASGQSYDFTIRIGLPQLERDRVTSVIKTTNAAATRAADVVGPAPEVPEDASPAWDNNATYNAGDRRYVLSTHRIYESVQNNNTGKDPTLAVNQYNAAGAPTWWIDIGPTNRTAAFDGEVQSQTLAASPLVITLAPGAFNGFALFGVDADTFQVDVLDAPNGNVIYSEPTTALEGSMPGDYYEYFFERFKPLRQLIRSGIDPYGSGQIRLTLKRATGLVGVGMFAIGDFRPSGVALKGTSVEPTDFSSVVQDRFGRASVRRRANSTGMNVTTVMEEDEAGTVLQNIRDTLGTPCVVSATSVELYEWMTVFGTISAKLSDPPDVHPYKQLTLTVRGFI